MEESNFQKIIGEDPKRLAKFFITQFPVIMACEARKHYTGSVVFPPVTADEVKIQNVCKMIAEAFFEVNNADEMFVESNVFSIKAQNWRLVFKVENGTIKYDLFGIKAEDIFRRGNLLNAIDINGIIPTTPKKLTDAVLSAFEKDEKPIISNNEIELKFKLDNFVKSTASQLSIA